MQPHEYTVNPERFINFYGQDWIVIKTWLQYQEETCIGRLIGDASPDEANKLRGQLQIIRALLNLEAQAAALSRLNQ